MVGFLSHLLPTTYCAGRVKTCRARSVTRDGRLGRGGWLAGYREHRGIITWVKGKKKKKGKRSTADAGEVGAKRTRQGRLCKRAETRNGVLCSACFALGRLPVCPFPVAIGDPSVIFHIPISDRWLYCWLLEKRLRLLTRRPRGLPWHRRRAAERQWQGERQPRCWSKRPSRTR